MACHFFSSFPPLLAHTTPLLYIAARNSMAWDSIIGQTRAKNLLRAAITGGRVPHAYLFTGAEGVGKDAAAIELAKALRCQQLGPQATPCGNCRNCQNVAALQHSNVRFVFALPTGKGEDGRADSPLLKLSDGEISQIQEQVGLKAANPYHNITIPRAQQIKISSIREVKRDIAFAATEPGWRIVIISEAHQMGEEAANAFLKTLEEPAPNTLLILTSSHKEQLLQTILSRCQEVRFDMLTDAEIAEALVARNNIPRKDALLLSKLAEGSYSRAVELTNSDLQQLRFDVVSFLRAALKRSPMSVFAEVERLTTGTDRRGLERTLMLLLLWFRDAMLLRLTGREESVVNQDQVKDIQSFNSKFANASTDRLIRSVEEAIGAVRGNAQSQLAFIVLALRMESICYS